ncbi:hypothetical protein GIR22_04395 [Pseudomonas sp. CCM 7891]|uniref:Glutamine amidotransferase n=1 Tax=Pseudomonas karstica TaxID=1055468 RepID=A0A7X2RR36_9PSED|nr:hypothetical protein [Pseudomonas karstica]
MSRLPLIGVTACSRQVGLHAYHISGDKCVRAVAIAAKGRSMIIPSLAPVLDPANILDGLAAIVFIGSPSHLQSPSARRAAPIRGAARDSARVLLDEYNVIANGR